MAPTFGKELCESYIGTTVRSLGMDASLRVRKEAIYSLKSIIAIVGEKCYRENLLPFYI